MPYENEKMAITSQAISRVMLRGQSYVLSLLCCGEGAMPTFRNSYTRISSADKRRQCWWGHGVADVLRLMSNETTTARAGTGVMSFQDQDS